MSQLSTADMMEDIPTYWADLLSSYIHWGFVMFLVCAALCTAISYRLGR